MFGSLTKLRRSLLLPAALGLLFAYSPTAEFGTSLSRAEPPAQAAPPAGEAKAGEAKAGEAKAGEAKAGEAKAGEERTPPAAAEADRVAWFERYMSGATLAGRFTVVGKDQDEMPEEEYTILKCEKLPEGDLYRFTARIRYGETDAELPMDLPVLWAGDTPVISLTNLWIPGLGTFSSRVMIYRGRYAGTWTHGEVGGHLFGVIKKGEVAEEAK